MDYRPLGNSGITVSRLCFGSLTISPSQANLSIEEGGELIAYAIDKGVNFIDTADLYDTYGHIRHALKNVSTPPVISTKSYAWNRNEAEQALDRARRELDLDVIDIFLLHEQESVLTMHGHSEAFNYLCEQKQKGVIRAVGLSTHAVEPVRALTQAVGGDGTDLWAGIDRGPWYAADVVHPLLNMSGIGLLDGQAPDMLKAVEEASETGIGIFGMKMLGGGHLISNFQQAVQYALSIDAAASYAVGMQTMAEVDANIKLFSGVKSGSEQDYQVGSGKARQLIVSDWCTGCGKCVERCKSKALTLKAGKVVVDHTRCTLCSYCATVCRDFVLKII